MRKQVTKIDKIDAYCSADVSRAVAVEWKWNGEFRAAADISLIPALIVAIQRRFSFFPPATLAHFATRSRVLALHLGGNMANFAICANSVLDHFPTRLTLIPST
jgi:hypothetical protein